MPPPTSPPPRRRAVNTDHATLELAARIRHLRLRRGLTIQACATAAGVARDSWRHWEHARARPRAIYTARIARALNEPIGALFAPAGAITLPDITVTPERAHALEHATHTELEHLALELATALTAHLAAELRLRSSHKRQQHTRSTSRAAVPSSPAAVRARIEARRGALEASPEEG